MEVSGRNSVTIMLELIGLNIEPKHRCQYARTITVFV